MPTLQEVSQSILAGIGIDNPSESQLRSVAAWITAEKPPLGGRDTFSNNPLNTTLGLDGRGTGQVQQYSDLQTGINQNIATLKERPYTAVRAALAAGGGQPFFDALKASPWDADHYAGRDLGTLAARAPLTAEYTFQGTGAQKINLSATGAGGAAVAADTPSISNELTEEYTRQRDDAKKRLDTAQKKLDAIDLVKAYKADKKTPTDKWLKDRDLKQTQLDAALLVYNEVIGPEELVTGAKNLAQLQKERDDAQNDFNRAGTALTRAQTTARGNQSPLFTTPGPNEKFILERRTDGTLVLNPDGTPKTKLNPNYEPPKEDKPSVHVVSLPDQSFLVDDAGKVIQSFKKDPANETRVEAGFLVTYNPKTGDVVSKTDIRSELQKVQDTLAGKKLQSEADLAEFKLTTLKNLSTAIAGLDQITDPEQKRLAQRDILQKYAALTDPGAALTYAQNQADLQEKQRLDLEDQTGFVHELGTLQPRLDRDTGQPMLTMKAQKQLQDQQNALQTQRISAAQTAETQATQAASETEKYQARYLPAEAAAPFEAMNAAYASGKPIPAPGLVTYQAHETPMEVHQRVYQSVLQALSPQSPLARQLLSQQGGAPDTMSTTGTPAQAAALNAMTTAGTVNGPAQGPPAQMPAQGPIPAVPGAGASPLALPPTPSQGQLEGHYGQVQPPPQTPAQPVPAPVSPPAPVPPLYQLFQQYGLPIGAAKAGAVA